MSLVRPEYHIPSYDEIRDLGAKMAEAVIAKDLAALIDDPNIILTEKSILEIYDLVSRNFDSENRKVVHDAFVRAASREGYKEILFSSDAIYQKILWGGLCELS